ncbi:hypothetical protein Ate01nite_08060 [Actinoplanes teichomyceticus]|nr:hypothetical protein Ate01nite_08060 [Actinoplanes teichomyceticus]
MGADARSRNGSPAPPNATTSSATRPPARIRPATPPKIINCRRRRCGPVGGGAAGGGDGGGGTSGGTPDDVTVPDDHAPPGPGRATPWDCGSDMASSEHHTAGKRRADVGPEHTRTKSTRPSCFPEMSATVLSWNWCIPR